MRQGILQNTSPFAKIMFSAFIVISSFLITLVAGLFLAVPFFGIGFMELFESLSKLGHPDYVNMLKYFQAVQSIGLFVIPPFILGWFFGGNSFRYLKLTRKVSVKTIVFTTLIMISAIPFINLLAHWNAQLSLPDFMSSVEEWMRQTEETAQELTKTFLRAETPGDLLLNIFIIAVIPAVGEELLFRGILQRLFSEWTRSSHAGILITAIIFSAMHLQFFGFVPRTVLGILFGYMLVWSGRMWIPVTAHFVNNAVAVTLFYFIQRKQISEDIETFGAESGHWIYMIPSMVIFIILLVIYYNRMKNPPDRNRV
jgi:uncharacterized protein